MANCFNYSVVKWHFEFYEKHNKKNKRYDLKVITLDDITVAEYTKIKYLNQLLYTLKSSNRKLKGDAIKNDGKVYNNNAHY